MHLIQVIDMFGVGSKLWVTLIWPLEMRGVCKWSQLHVEGLYGKVHTQISFARICSGPEQSYVADYFGLAHVPYGK